MIELKNKIPDDFLKEETRCGHLVTKKMKEVWAVELDLLMELDRVCKKYGLKYHAGGGTLIGAVRHSGFIPWDDDIDISMFREDYERLCSVAEKEFIKPYFFQTAYTEIGYKYGYAKLRNSQTTAIENINSPLKFKFNQGIKIDIFPIDNVCDDDVLYKRQIKKANLLLKLANQCVASTKQGIYYHPNPIVRMERFILSRTCGSLMNRFADRFYRKFEKVCMKYNNVETEKVAPISLLHDQKKFQYRKDGYSKMIDMPFEFISIPVGCGYDEELKTQYGNWRIYVKDGAMHGQLFFDTDKSYLEYIK